MKRQIDSYRPSARRGSSRHHSPSFPERDRTSDQTIIRESDRRSSSSIRASDGHKSSTSDPMPQGASVPTPSSLIPYSPHYSPPYPLGSETIGSSIQASVRQERMLSSRRHSSVRFAASPATCSSPLANPSSRDSERQAVRTPQCNEDCEQSKNGLQCDTDNDLDLQRNRGLCKNYDCLGEHGYQDCPKPKVCWGCRSTNHYWSYCPMTCTHCQAERHSAKYCSDFEINATGKSQPKTPHRIPEESSNVDSTSIHDHNLDPATQQRPSPFGDGPKCGPKVSPPMSAGRLSRGSITRRASQDRAVDFLDNLYQSTHIPKGPAAITSRPVMFNGFGEKIYCTLWLRSGHCDYYYTSHGCKYKHDIPPDEATQRDTGANLSSPWLQGAPFAGTSRRLVTQ